MKGSYDYRLVALSVLIAVFASYAALELSARTTAARGRVRLAWLIGGAATMGLARKIHDFRNTEGLAMVQIR